MISDSDSFHVGSAGGTEHGVDKQSNSASHLAFSLGGVKSSGAVSKPHGVVFSMQVCNHHLARNLDFLSHRQLMELRAEQCLPLNMETEDGTVYVNSKQYHGIIRRRQSRAKAAAVLEHNKRTSRSRKPLMHHSRHLHALRRPRGSGGRFLNTKSKKADETKQTHPQPQQSNSRSSEVFNPDSQIMKLIKRTKCLGIRSNKH